MRLARVTIFRVWQNSLQAHHAPTEELELRSRLLEQAPGAAGGFCEDEQGVWREGQGGGDAVGKAMRVSMVLGRGCVRARGLHSCCCVAVKGGVDAWGQHSRRGAVECVRIVGVGL